jgi:hypothetical protein
MVARRHGSFGEFPCMDGVSTFLCLLWDVPTRILCSAAFRIILEMFVALYPQFRNHYQ